MTWTRPAIALAGAALFFAGVLAAQSLPDAWAQDPTEAPADAAPSYRLTPRLLCRTFAMDPEKSDLIETSDQTTEIGQWIAAQEAEGWELYGLDFEVGQKATGYPQAWVQVCLQPAA